MSIRRSRRHRTERGFTLIEILVVIVGLAVSVTLIGADFANSQKLAFVATEQSLLEVTMRQVTDNIRAPFDAGLSTAVQYVFCATSSSSSSSGAYAVPPSVGSNPVVAIMAPAGPVKTWSITVVNGKAADRKDVNGNLLPLQPAPFEDCTTGTFNPSSCAAGDTCDWGVQQLIITIALVDGRSLTRTVFKSEAA